MWFFIYLDLFCFVFVFSFSIVIICSYFLLFFCTINPKKQREMKSSVNGTKKGKHKTE